MTTTISQTIADAAGLREEDRDTVRRLVNTWRGHYSGNVLRNKYYQSHSMLKDLGISVPDSLKNLEVACGWGYKTVEVMRDHLHFDGFDLGDMGDDDTLRALSRRNTMDVRVGKAVNSALKYCFTMWVVTAAPDGHARISAYPPTLATGIYNDITEQLDAGMFVVDFEWKNNRKTDKPSWIDVMLPDCMIQLHKLPGGGWSADYVEHGLGIVPMFVMPYNPDDDRPFGNSRITPEVQWLIDCAIRLNVNEEIASAFAASTQKYLLGTDGESLEGVSRWDAFIGSILEVEMNSDGGTPQFGQLTQPSMQPLTDHFNNLCKRMSAATGIHVGQFGLQSDNPSSAEAIYAENEPLILKCRSFIREAKAALRRVGIAAMATEAGVSYTEAESAYDVNARFLNPAMPTLAQMADSSIKLAGVVEGFANTPTFWRMNGLDNDESRDVRREVSDNRARDEARSAAIAVAAQVESVQELPESAPQLTDGEVADDGI